MIYTQKPRLGLSVWVLLGQWLPALSFRYRVVIQADEEVTL